MKNKVSISRGMTFMVVLALALVLCLTFAVQAVGNTPNALAANYDANYDYAGNGMLKDIAGASVGSNKVVSYPNGRSDSAHSGGDQWSYFPKKYLNVTETGTYDLSGLLQNSMNNNKRGQWNTDPDNRFIGYERKGSSPMAKNNADGLNSVNQSYHGDWIDSSNAKGIYLHKVRNKNDRYKFKTMLYFNFAIPQGVGAKYQVTLTAKGWGDEIYSGGYWHDRLESGMAIYESASDAGASNLFTMPNDAGANSIGLNHNETSWVQDNANGLTDTINVRDASRVYNHELIRFNGNDSLQGSNSNIDTGKITANDTTKFVRVAIAWENQKSGNDGSWADDGDLQFLLSNLKLNVEIPVPENPADYSNVNKYLPNAEIAQGEDVSQTGFPIGMADKGEGNASVIDGYQFGQNVDLTKFATRTKTSGITKLVGDTSFESNKIGITAQGDPGKQTWRYMYGYVKLPDNLAQNGGYITVEADTVGYTSLQQPVGTHRTGHKYFSVVAGTDVVKNRSMHPDELIDIDIENGATNVQDGKNLGGIENSNLNNSNSTKQRVTIYIKPGQKYIRISYIHMFTSEGSTHDSLGQSMTNLKINEAFYDYPKQVNGHESDYVPAINWDTQNVIHMNATQANLNNVISCNHGVAYNVWKTDTLNADVFGYSGSTDSAITRNSKTISYAGNNNDWKYIYTYLQVPTELQGKTISVSADILGYNAGGNGKAYLSLVAGKRFWDNGTNNNATDMEMNKSSGQTTIINGKNSADAPLDNYKVSIRTQPGEALLRLSLVYFAPSNSGAIGQKMTNIRVFEEEKVAPTAQEPTFRQTSSTGGIISIVASDNGVIKNVVINGQNLHDVIMTADGNTYSTNVTEAGAYTITITDLSGNFITKDINVQLDIAAPEVSINKDNTLAINSKYVEFFVTDANGVDAVTVSFNGNNIELTTINGADAKNKHYQINATEAGNYLVATRDIFGNEIVYGIMVTNIVKAGTDVKLTDVTANSVKVTVNNANMGRNIIAPVIEHGTAVENSNYGNKAVYTVTFDTAYDCSQTINANYIDDASVQLRLIMNKDVDGTVTEEYNQVKNFKFEDRFTANDEAGKKFIGWYDNNGVLLTTDSVFNFVLASDMEVTKRYITVHDTTITFLNLANHVIDIKSFASSVGSVEQMIASSGVVAPENAFMTFDKWTIVDGEGTNNITVKAHYNVDDTRKFTIKVNYANGTNETLNNRTFNEYITLKGRDTASTGWVINGIKVSDKQDYSFHVTGNITIYELKGEQSNNAGAMSISDKDANGYRVITGYLPTIENISEIGFILADGAVPDERVVLESNVIYKVPVYSITNTNQFIIAVDCSADAAVNYAGHKVRLYTIATGGTISYGAISTIGQ